MTCERKDRWVVALGIALLVAYLVQAQLELVWPWLAQQQADDTYKGITGCVLGGYLVWQWTLRNRRLVDPVGAVRRHKLAGAFAPLVLYIHASRFGYGYLLVLAISYLSITALGLAHRTVLQRGRLFAWWFVVHVATATMLMLLAAYHVVIAVAYE